MSKIKTTKVYCDVCGRRIESLVTQVRLYRGFLYMSPKGTKTKVDVCGECVSVIRKMVKANCQRPVNEKEGKND